MDDSALAVVIRQLKMLPLYSPFVYVITNMNSQHYYNEVKQLNYGHCHASKMHTIMNINYFN